MTKKRFTFHHDVDGVDYIEDESNGFCLICDELMCNLLNELYEENQKCKEYNGILYANYTKTDRKLVKQISELKQENGQLKSELNAIREERRSEFEIGNGW